MKKKDLDYIARLEKAIEEKYGKDAVKNPKANWNEEKEKEYLEQLKEFYNSSEKKKEQYDKIENDGFLISKHLIIKKNERNCPHCDIYSFDIRDDLYINKFKCCFNCCIEYVEGREERWLNGWRPNKEQN